MVGIKHKEDGFDVVFTHFNSLSQRTQHLNNQLLELFIANLCLLTLFDQLQKMAILPVPHQTLDLFLHLIDFDRQYNGYFFVDLFLLLVGTAASHFLENLCAQILVRKCIFI